MLDGIVFEFLLGAVLLKARRDKAKLKEGLRFDSIAKKWKSRVPECPSRPDSSV